MNTALQKLSTPLVVAAVALLAACSADVSAPSRAAALSDEVAALSKRPDLGDCQKLAAPPESKLAFHAFADGVQIYRWNGTTWAFVAPSATLFANAGGTGRVGTHYSGPTWESNSASKVVAAAIDRCTPDVNSIPWLSLGAVSSEGPGVFSRIIFIQRVNTVGGVAPSAPGNIVGEEKQVPYTAEYFFYRAE